MTADGGAVDPRVWQGEPTVRDVGEFGLIERFRRRLGSTPDPATGTGAPAGVSTTTVSGSSAGASTTTVSGSSAAGSHGIGDDAAIFTPEPGWDLLLTCDMQIEGRHFQRRWLTPRELGARAAAVNLSDVAAMGGLPVGALLSLGLPPGLPLAVLDEFFDGFVAGLGAHGAAVLGGNISAADDLLIDVTLIGRVEQGMALRRDGARPGDVLFVTGAPGRAAAALASLDADPAVWRRLAERLEEDAPPAELRERFRRALAAPRARLAAGRYLLENRLATAAIDTSDGLAGDLRHLCDESGLGAVIEEAFLPVDPDLTQLAALLDRDPLAWMLGASDDYELLFAVAPECTGLVFAMRAGLPGWGIECRPAGGDTAHGGGNAAATRRGLGPLVEPGSSMS